VELTTGDAEYLTVDVGFHYDTFEVFPGTKNLTGIGGVVYNH
jgi:hypothetical protein